MNTIFNSAHKQSTSIHKQLEQLTSSTSESALTAAAIGAVSSSITSFSRTLDEYHNLSRQELDPTKKEKAQERIRKFRAELQDFRGHLGSLQARREQVVQAGNRRELMDRRSYTNSTPENPYATTSTSAMGPAPVNRYSSWAREAAAVEGALGTDGHRAAHVAHERSFINQTNMGLDDLISRGQAVLGNLEEQESLLKGVQKRLYTAGTTLGISGDTIRMIERRAKQDKWIFYGGCIVCILFFWACIHFLR